MKVLIQVLEIEVAGEVQNKDLELLYALLSREGEVLAQHARFHLQDLMHQFDLQLTTTTVSKEP